MTGINRLRRLDASPSVASDSTTEGGERLHTTSGTFAGYQVQAPCWVVQAGLPLAAAVQRVEAR